MDKCKKFNNISMKRLLSFVALAFACSSMMAQAVIKFEKTVVNFGNFKEDKVQTCEDRKSVV